MNECLVLTLLFLMNNPVTRCYVRPNVGLEVIYTVHITDVGNVGCTLGTLTTQQKMSQNEQLVPS